VRAYPQLFKAGKRFQTRRGGTRKLTWLGNLVNKQSSPGDLGKRSLDLRRLCEPMKGTVVYEVCSASDASFRLRKFASARASVGQEVKDSMA